MALKIGFVGNGLISWAHAMALRSIGDSNLVEFSFASNFDENFERANQFSQFNGSKLAENADEVIASSDAVWICTPTSSHKELVRKCSEQGVATFCEKPLALDFSDAKEIASIAEASGIVFQVGLVLRTCPVFIKLKSIVENRSLGNPMAVNMRDDQFFPVQGHYASKWRADVEQAGVGTLIEHSIHDIDILRFCFGEVESMSANISNNAQYVGIEDVAGVRMVHDSGVISNLTSVWHQITSRPSTRRVEVFFEKGLIWLENDFIGPLNVIKDSGHEVIECEPTKDVASLSLPDTDIGLAVKMYVQENLVFLNAAMGISKGSLSVKDAVEAHHLIEKAYLSAAEGGKLIKTMQ